MFGAAAMSLSSFCVVTNALRLNLFDVHGAKHDHKINPVSAPAASSAPVAEAPAEDKESNSNQEDPTMKKTLHVEGMMCGHPARPACKKHWKPCPRSARRSMSHTAGTAIVTLYRRGLQRGRLKKAVEDQDYQVTGIE